MNSPQDCSLNGSSHHTTDDPLLGEDVDDEDRGHGHQVGGEGHRIVRRELALEHVLCERNRLIALISQRDQRQQEVVPRPQAGENPHGRVHGREQREDDPPENGIGRDRQ